MPLNVVRYPKLCKRDAGTDYLIFTKRLVAAPGFEPGNAWV